MLAIILSLILPTPPALGAGVEPLMPAAVHRPPALSAPVPAGLPKVLDVEGAVVDPVAGPENKLWLFNRGLDESVGVSYGGAAGPLSPAVKRQIDHLMRSRDGAEMDMSQELLDLLARIHRHFNFAPVQVVCGYRNPKYKAGGVGYYPKRRFVHVDVGPVRSW